MEDFELQAAFNKSLPDLIRHFKSMEELPRLNDYLAERLCRQVAAHFLSVASETGQVVPSLSKQQSGSRPLPESPIPHHAEPEISFLYSVPATTTGDPYGISSQQHIPRIKLETTGEVASSGSNYPLSGPPVVSESQIPYGGVRVDSYPFILDDTHHGAGDGDDNWNRPFDRMMPMYSPRPSRDRCNSIESQKREDSEQSYLGYEPPALPFLNSHSTIATPWTKSQAASPSSQSKRPDAANTPVELRGLDSEVQANQPDSPDRVDKSGCSPQTGTYDVSLFSVPMPGAEQSRQQADVSSRSNESSPVIDLGQSKQVVGDQVKRPSTSNPQPSTPQTSHCDVVGLEPSMDLDSTPSNSDQPSSESADDTDVEELEVLHNTLQVVFGLTVEEAEVPVSVYRPLILDFVRGLYSCLGNVPKGSGQIASFPEESRLQPITTTTNPGTSHKKRQFSTCDDSSQGNSRTKLAKKPRNVKTSQRKFSCPYRKRNPEVFSVRNAFSCSMTGYDSISKVKYVDSPLKTRSDLVIWSTMMPKLPVVTNH